MSKMLSDVAKLLTRMGLIKTILVVTILVAGAAVWIVSDLWVEHAPGSIEQQRLYLDAYSAIGIGFLAALIGTIIPNLILESRDNLERARQSRTAYSQAKTSVIYLPGSLAVREYGEAMAALQESHQELHMAETYGRELEEYLEWYGDKRVWTDQTYWELTAVRTLLQSRADQWGQLSVGERTIMVDQSLEAIRDLFGTRGEKWKKLTEEQRELRAKEVVAKLRSADSPA